MRCPGVFCDAAFSIDSEPFRTDVYVLPLGGHDMVLGTDWLPLWARSSRILAAKPCPSGAPTDESGGVACSDRAAPSSILSMREICWTSSWMSLPKCLLLQLGSLHHVPEITPSNSCRVQRPWPSAPTDILSCRRTNWNVNVAPWRLRASSAAVPRRFRHQFSLSGRPIALGAYVWITEPSMSAQ